MYVQHKKQIEQELVSSSSIWECRKIAFNGEIQVEETLLLIILIQSIEYDILSVLSTNTLKMTPVEIQHPKVCS